MEGGESFKGVQHYLMTMLDIVRRGGSESALLGRRYGRSGSIRSVPIAATSRLGNPLQRCHINGAALAREDQWRKVCLANAIL